MLQNSPRIAEPVAEGGAPILPLCDSKAHAVPLCHRRPPTRGGPSQRLTYLSDGTLVRMKELGMCVLGPGRLFFSFHPLLLSVVPALRMMISSHFPITALMIRF